MADIEQETIMKKWAIAWTVLVLAGGLAAVGENGRKMEKATLGGGCFWCVEAVMEQVDGVESAVSGYMGGHVENPTYQQVCSGRSGHAEVVQVTFDPEKVSYEEILKWFWQAHDPTQLNRQGNDVGPQYRSVIFYHSDQQREIAEKSKAAVDASGAFSKPLVTEISKADTFYEAEPYHQEYYFSNKSAPYCQFVIRPKLEKLKLDH
jgi:peptide-methionine (S)-S-oxide reductase